jgi:general secretion pathway protein L
MRPIAVLEMWVDTLARLLLRLQEAWRSRRLLTVTPQESDFVVRQRAPRRESLLGTFSIENPAPPDIARVARQSFVVLELPAENVVVSRINVPAQARGFLDGVIRNQIERLAPWRANEVAHGYCAEPHGEQPNMLCVRVIIAPLTIMDAMRQTLATIGFPVDRISTHESGLDSEPAVALWSQLANMPAGGLQRARRSIALGLAGCVILSLTLSLWSGMSAMSIQERSDEARRRVADLQRQLQRSRAAPEGAAIGSDEDAWHLKETLPSAVITIENLSRALPDVAHVTEFNLQQKTLRISGLTVDAPSLIASLEESGHFEQVHFFSPTTRAPNGKFSFHIEGQVKAGPAKAEE